MVFAWMVKVALNIACTRYEWKFEYIDIKEKVGQFAIEKLKWWTNVTEWINTIIQMYRVLIVCRDL